MTIADLISRLERHWPLQPMRREDRDEGELEIDKAEPHEDEREHGSPVGVIETNHPFWPGGVQ